MLYLLAPTVLPWLCDVTSEDRATGMLDIGSGIVVCMRLQLTLTIADLLFVGPGTPLQLAGQTPRIRDFSIGSASASLLHSPQQKKTRARPSFHGTFHGTFHTTFRQLRGSVVCRGVMIRRRS